MRARCGEIWIATAKRVAGVILSRGGGKRAIGVAGSIAAGSWSCEPSSLASRWYCCPVSPFAGARQGLVWQPRCRRGADKHWVTPRSTPRGLFLAASGSGSKCSGRMRQVDHAVHTATDQRCRLSFPAVFFAVELPAVPAWQRWLGNCSVNRCANCESRGLKLLIQAARGAACFGTHDPTSRYVVANRQPSRLMHGRAGRSEPQQAAH